MKSFLRAGQKTWVHYEGRTFLYEEEKIIKSRSKVNNTASSGKIESPMPGKIFKILVKNGDTVKTNQTVCIIEAMKMEYAMKAPFDGKVLSVNKQVGQQINLSELILEIEKI
jgi:biotin carboxyl carrier protein